MHKLPLFAALMLLSACGETPTSQPKSGETAAQPEAKPIAVGETGKAKGVDITINSVKVTSQVGPAGVAIKAEAGETFVVVTYSIKNTADKTLSFMERPALTLIDANGHSYTADEMLGAMAVAISSDASSTSIDLNPGTSTKAGMAWKIAKDGFDKGTWNVVAETDPALTFSLK